MEALGCHRGCVANARRSWVTATSASTSCCLSETDLSSLSSADLVASLADEVDAIVRHFFALPAHIRLLCSAEARRAAEQAFRCAVDFRDLLHRMAAPTRRSRRRRQHYRQHYPAEEGDVSSSSRTMRDIEIDSTATTGYGRPTGAVTLDSGDNAVDRETKVPCLSAARRGLTGFEASSSMALGGFSNDRREVQLKKRIRRQRGETDGGGEASASSSATVTKPSSSSVDHLDEGESLKGRGKGDRDVPVDDDRRGQYETPKQCPREAECPVSIDDETSVSRGTLSGSIGRRRGPRRDHRHHLWLGLRHLRGGSDGEQQGRDGPVCVHLKARAPSAWGFRRQGGMGEVGRGGGGKASDGPQRQLRVCSECVAPSWRTANSSHPIVQRLQAPLVSVAVGQGGVRGLCGEKTGLCNVCGSVPGRSISTASFSGTEESERDMQAVDYEKKLSAIALSLPFIPLEQRIGVLARVSRAVYRLVYEAPIEYADFRSSFSSSEDDSAESDIGAAAAPPRSPVGNEARHSPLHQPPQLSSSSSSSTLGKQPPFPQERDRDEGDNKTAAASNGAAVDEERHCSPQQWVATSSGRRLRAVQLLSRPVFSRRLAPRLSRLVTLKVRCGDQPLISLLNADHLKHLELRFSQSDDLVALARWLAAAARASSLRFLKCVFQPNILFSSSGLTAINDRHRHPNAATHQPPHQQHGPAVPPAARPNGAVPPMEDQRASAAASRRFSLSLTHLVLERVFAAAVLALFTDFAYPGLRSLELSCTHRVSASAVGDFLATDVCSQLQQASLFCNYNVSHPQIMRALGNLATLRHLSLKTFSSAGIGALQSPSLSTLSIPLDTSLSWDLSACPNLSFAHILAPASAVLLASSTSSSIDRLLSPFIQSGEGGDHAISFRSNKSDMTTSADRGFVPHRRVSTSSSSAVLMELLLDTDSLLEPYLDHAAASRTRRSNEMLQTVIALLEERALPQLAQKLDNTVKCDSRGLLDCSLFVCFSFCPPGLLSRSLPEATSTSHDDETQWVSISPQAAHHPTRPPLIRHEIPLLGPGSGDGEGTWRIRPAAGRMKERSGECRLRLFVCRVSV